MAGEKTSKKKLIMKVVKALFMVAVVFFLGKYFVDNWESFTSVISEINWWVFAGSMLFYFAYKLTLACLWHYITVLNQCQITLPRAVSSYLYSILGKYIPGKVFMLAARLPAYTEKGIPIRKPTICFFIENVCTLLGAAFLFLISLFFFPNEELRKYMWAALILVVVFFVMINPKIINFFLKRFGKLIKKDDMEIPMTYPDMLKVVLLFVANWLIVGAGFYLLSLSIYPDIPLSQMMYVGGVFALSAIIGILSIFAPSGIGVREGIMILGLALILPAGYPEVIAIVSRLWVTVAELLLILIAFVCEQVIKLIAKKRAKTTPSDKL